jgi:hypothetical protein
MEAKLSRRERGAAATAAESSRRDQRASAL